MIMSARARWLLILLMSIMLLLAAALSALFWDRVAAALADSMASPPLDGVADVMSTFGNPAMYFIPGAITFLACAADKRQRLRRDRALFVLVNSSSAGLCADLLKYLIGRSRPHLFLERSIYELHPLTSSWDFNSFPSEHAAIASAMAATFAMFIPAYWPTFFLLTAIVCCSRILVGAHYPSDVLTGCLIGVMTTVAFRSLFLSQGLVLSPKRQRSLG